MGHILRQFVPRAPRYVLNGSDKSWMFIAPAQSHGQKLSTRIVNLSESGLAFLIEKKSAPQIGDLIKVEFPIPANDQVAWWAKVVRIEEHFDPWGGVDALGPSPDFILIAIRFEQLPEAHVQEIRQGLFERFQEQMKAERARVWAKRKIWLKEQGPNIALFLFCTLTGVAALYGLSLVEPFFDVKLGSIYRKLWEGLDF